jgi:TatA/E family protein of Tat protein translocase
MPQLGPAEILVILVVALLVFGPKRLPEVGRQVGRGLKELRKLQDTVRDEINDVLHHDSDDEPPSYVTTPAPAPTPVAGAGRPAPSRFRPAATPALGSVVSAASAASAPSTSPSASPPPPSPPSAPRPTPTPAPTSGAHAPSRFRAPGR